MIKMFECKHCKQTVIHTNHNGLCSECQFLFGEVFVLENTDKPYEEWYWRKEQRLPE